MPYRYNDFLPNFRKVLRFLRKISCSNIALSKIHAISESKEVISYLHILL